MKPFWTKLKKLKSCPGSIFWMRPKEQSHLVRSVQGICNGKKLPKLELFPCKGPVPDEERLVLLLENGPESCVRLLILAGKKVKRQCEVFCTQLEFSWLLVVGGQPEEKEGAK